MTPAAATVPVCKPAGIKDKVLPGHWYQLKDLTPDQHSQAVSVFQGKGLENHLYLVHDVRGNVLDREHVSAFAFADLNSINAI